MVVIENGSATRATQEAGVFLPELPYTPEQLKAQGYHSVGLDIVIGSIDPATGEPVFLFEECAETAKTHAGQLAHPKETMKWTPDQRPETFDETIRRCLRQELDTSIDTVPLSVNPDGFMTEADTYVVRNGVKVQYKAFLFSLWAEPGFSGFPKTVNNKEVQGVRTVSLGEILSGDPTGFRECTQAIFTTLQTGGFFNLDGVNLTPLAMRPPNAPTGLTNIDLRQLHA